MRTHLNKKKLQRMQWNLLYECKGSKLFRSKIKIETKRIKKVAEIPMNTRSHICRLMDFFI